ncbi:MAG: PAS domain S-box protein [Candidatus Brocadiales bacterium]|nr:PAS domain S-box protein [Candidatus Brocadiales bacterium]
MIESEDCFRRMFEDSAVGMVLGDESGRYLKVNRAMTEILGYSREELLCMGTQDTTYKGDITPDSDIARQLWTGERDSFHIEKRYIHKDGHVIWGDVTVSAIHDSNGKTNFVFWQLVDITERKKAEGELEQKQYYLERAQEIGIIGT